MGSMTTRRDLEGLGVERSLATEERTCECVNWEFLHPLDDVSSFGSAPWVGAMTP